MDCDGASLMADDEVIHDGPELPPTSCLICSVPCDGHADLFEHGRLFHPEVFHDLYVRGMEIKVQAILDEDGISNVVTLEMFTQSGPEGEDVMWVTVAIAPEMAAWMAHHAHGAVHAATTGQVGST